MSHAYPNQWDPNMDLRHHPSSAQYDPQAQAGVGPSQHLQGNPGSAYYHPNQGLMTDQAPPLRSESGFAPRQGWVQPQYPHPHSQPRLPTYHQRPQHHPYANVEHQIPRHIRPPNSGSPPSLGHPPPTAHDEAHARSVSRAACLSCRSAKRKCDGVKPICGPCALRGVKEDMSQKDGGCLYVASKRGGPRFKGVKGAEATRRKLEERERLGKGKLQRLAGDSHPEYESYQGQSPEHANDSFSFAPNEAVHSSSGSQQAPYLPGAVKKSFSDSGGISPHTSASPRSLILGSQQSHVDVDTHGASDFGERSEASRFTFGDEREALSHPNYFHQASMGAAGGLFSDVSPTSIETWQRIHNINTNPGFSLANLYQKLENLPKAGVISISSVDEVGNIEVDMSHALEEIASATKTSVAVNSEQQARALLSDYYELVYPGCPVMLPSGHLSSIAFHLSDDDSSALLAATSACVALQLPQREVHRIVRGSMHFHSQDGAETTAGLNQLENASRQEIARFHAKSAERLLLKKVALLSKGAALAKTPHHDSTAPPLPDLQLVRIKLVATHTLLSHYYSGTSDPKRGFHHSSQAWNHAQGLQLDDTTATSSSPSWFSTAQKCEWARRVFWASYTAATVMSCTGGFPPLTVKRNSVKDLDLLPSPNEDKSGWKVLIKGAQFVSRAYAGLYDLDSFKNDSANQVSEVQAHSRQHQQRWESIFGRMQQVDHDVMNYTRHDPCWKDESCFAPGVGLHRRTSLFEEENEVRLGRSLRVAGKLMTSGALIILHRAQAFANARIFVAPTCGIPGACDEIVDETTQPKARRPAADRLWYRALDEGASPGPAHGLSGSASDTQLEEAAGQEPARPNTSESGSASLSGGSHSSNSSTTGTTGTKVGDVSLSSCGIPRLFSGGPFEPSISLDRCRFAAMVMYAQLGHIGSSTFQHGRRESAAVLPVETSVSAMSGQEWSAPCLPPFSACSLVLAAYVLLMETLHAQIATGEYVPRPEDAEEEYDLPAFFSTNPDRKMDARKITGRQAHLLAVRLRECIAEIKFTLDKFSRAWETAKGYSQEVSLLLEVNDSLFRSAPAV